MAFDLIEELKKSKELPTPEALYTQWSIYCSKYDHGEITKYEWEEMRSCIFPLLKAKSQIERQLNEVFIK